MDNISLEKILPSNLEAERSVLGAVLLSPEALHYASEHVGTDDFYLESHRKIFGAMLRLQAKEIYIDFVTLKEELQKSTELEAVGGAAYLAGLTDGLPRQIAVPYYAKIVKDKSLKRRLIALNNESMSRLYQDEEDFRDIVDEHQLRVLKLQASMDKSGGWLNAPELVDRVFKEIEAIADRSTKTIGLESGFDDLDRMTQGFKNGDLTIIAGRPSHGKTSLAVNIICHNILKHGKKVGFFTMEMSAEQIIKRALFAEAQIDSYRAGSGFLNKDDWNNLSRAAGDIAATNLFIEETGGLTIGEVRSKAQNLKIAHGVDLIVIDYLQLMSGSAETRKQGRNQELAEVSRGLKKLAKDLGVPLIALSQLSRKIEDEKTRKPNLADLRESGAIEQDADVVIFVWREEVRNPSPELAGLAELIIGKQRNGPIGTIQLAFLAQYTKFQNLYQMD